MVKSPFSKLLSVFSGIKKMPSSQTLRLVSSSGNQLEKSFSFGVDFGSTSIKLAQLGIINKKPRVLDLIVEDLPSELWISPAQRKKALPDIFRKITQKYKIKGGVITSIPASLVQMKTIRLPPMPQDEIDSAVQWAVKQDSAIPFEDISFDHYLLNDENLDFPVERDAMVITCSKKDIFEQMALIQAANLIPFAIEIDSFAAASALVHNGQIKKEEVVLILEFGFQGCSVNIVVNNRVQFKRELAVSGDSLTQSIAKRCQLSYDDAERVKKNFGLINNSGPIKENVNYEQEAAVMVNEALWLHLENLIQEIDYTFKYFSHQYTAEEIKKFDKIILSGGSANLNLFSSYLNSYIGMPVEVADPLRGLDLSEQIRSKFENLTALLPRLSVAVGLALRDLEA